MIFIRKLLADGGNGDREVIVREVDRCRQPTPIVQLIYRIVSDGSVRWSTRWPRVYDETGRPIAIEGGFDITPLKRAEQKLREASEKEDALAVLAHESKPRRCGANERLRAPPAMTCRDAGAPGGQLDGLVDDSPAEGSRHAA
jgi:hypothetical protein